MISSYLSLASRQLSGIIGLEVGKSPPTISLSEMATVPMYTVNGIQNSGFRHCMLERFLMKKNKKVTIFLFLIFILLVFLTQYKFSKTANLESQNIEAAVESNQQSNEQISNETLKSSESTKPFINEKSADVTSSVPEKMNLRQMILRKLKN